MQKNFKIYFIRILGVIKNKKEMCYIKESKIIFNFSVHLKAPLPYL